MIIIGLILELYTASASNVPSISEMRGDCNNGRDNSNNDRERQLNEFEESKAGVRGLLESGITHVPNFFILPPQDKLLEHSSHHSADHITIHNSDQYVQCQVPVIDLYGGFEDGGERRTAIVNEIRKASKEWGAFQILNHGVPIRVMDRMLESVREFHEQPKEAKVEFYTGESNSLVQYRATIHPLLKTALWKDTLLCRFEGNNTSSNPQVPTVCRDAMYDYENHMIMLKDKVSSLLSEALGLRSDHLERIKCMESNKLACHYYPPCPDPDLTLGSPKHADPYFLTFLLQNNIGGLQVMHQNHWVDVVPTKGAMIAVIGDMLQIVSNDLFRSAEHRVVPKRIGPRLSAACFFYPSASDQGMDRKYGVIEELAISDDNPPLYDGISMADYLKFFSLKGTSGSKALPLLKRRRLST